MTLTSSRCSLCSIIILGNLRSEVVLPLAMKRHPSLNITSRHMNLLIFECAEQRLATPHLTKPQKLQKSSCPTSLAGLRPPTVAKCHIIMATVMHYSMSWHLYMDETAVRSMKKGTCIFLIKHFRTAFMMSVSSLFFFFLAFSKGHRAKHFQCCPSHVVLQADTFQPSSLEDALFYIAQHGLSHPRLQEMELGEMGYTRWLVGQWFQS